MPHTTTTTKWNSETIEELVLELNKIKQRVIENVRVIGGVKTIKPIDLNIEGTYPDTAARDAAIPNPTKGMVILIGAASPYQMEYHNGTAWVDLGTHATQLNLSNYYTKTETDSKFAIKGESFTKAEATAQLAQKADVYTKDNIESKFEDLYKNGLDLDLVLNGNQVDYKEHKSGITMLRVGAGKVDVASTHYIAWNNDINIWDRVKHIHSFYEGVLQTAGDRGKYILTSHPNETLEFKAIADNATYKIEHRLDGLHASGTNVQIYYYGNLQGTDFKIPDRFLSSANHLHKFTLYSNAAKADGSKILELKLATNSDFVFDAMANLFKEAAELAKLKADLTYVNEQIAKLKGNIVATATPITDTTNTSEQFVNFSFIIDEKATFETAEVNRELHLYLNALPTPSTIYPTIGDIPANQDKDKKVLVGTPSAYKIYFWSKTSNAWAPSTIGGGDVGEAQVYMINIAKNKFFRVYNDHAKSAPTKFRDLQTAVGHTDKYIILQRIPDASNGDKEFLFLGVRDRTQPTSSDFMIDSTPIHNLEIDTI